MGPTVLVELEAGNDQLVEVVVEVVVETRPGQLVAVGLHSVMVTVLVWVWVDVMVVSKPAPSAAWAETSDRPAARQAMMLLNCIVAELNLEPGWWWLVTVRRCTGSGREKMEQRNRRSCRSRKKSTH